MKKFIIAMMVAITPLFFSTASANTCTAQLKFSNGRVFMNFTRYNSSGMRAACNDASYQCNYELAYRQSYGELPGGHCEVEGRRGGGYTCTFEMRSVRGRVIRSFFNRGSNEWQACQRAESNCISDLHYRQSQGRNPYARCVRGGGRGGDIVTRYCQVDRVDIYNRTIQQYHRQATGRRQTGVKRRACNKAMRACEANCWGDQRCIRIN